MTAIHVSCVARSRTVPISATEAAGRRPFECAQTALAVTHQTWTVWRTTIGSSADQRESPWEQSRVAVITGASQGFGAGLVKAYRDRNYRVIANSRSIKPSNDSDVLTVAGDVADPKTADRIVEEGLARFGRIDTLINNAGIFIAKPLVDYSDDDYASVVAINLGGFFRITRRVAAEMLKQGSGHIVQITTSLIDHANSNVPSVLASMTKGGLNAATKSLAIEYAKKGVRVNAVAPGVMKTPMHAPETHEFLAKMHPVGRMGEIKDIVDAILFLENAPFVTGEILHVDGGQSAGH